MKTDDNKFNITNNDIYMALKGMEVKNDNDISIIIENIDLNKIENLSSKEGINNEIKKQFIENRSSSFLVKKDRIYLELNTLFGLYKSIKMGFILS